MHGRRDQSINKLLYSLRYRHQDETRVDVTLDLDDFIKLMRESMFSLIPLPYSDNFLKYRQTPTEFLQHHCAMKTIEKPAVGAVQLGELRDKAIYSRIVAQVIVCDARMNGTVANSGLTVDIVERRLLEPWGPKDRGNIPKLTADWI